LFCFFEVLFEGSGLFIFVAIICDACHRVTWESASACCEANPFVLCVKDA
jgi:hypothetical protein